MEYHKDPIEESQMCYKILAMFKTIILSISPQVQSLIQLLTLIKAILIEIRPNLSISLVQISLNLSTKQCINLKCHPKCHLNLPILLLVQIMIPIN